ncbi:MAG: hypothetical protein WCQ83_02395, partial [Endomicrobiia bacterium]
VQTKYPDNYALLFAQEYNYKKFYEYEMKFRKDLRYPPFCNIAKLTIRNKDEKKALDFAQTISDFLDNQISATKCNIDLLGPSQSYISKLNGTYRWQIILKGTRKELKTLLEQVSTIKTPSETFINMELDPSDLL